MELLMENGAYIAAWLPSVLLTLALGSGLALLLLRGRISRSHSSSKAVARVMLHISLSLSIVGLIVAYGPMSPLFSTAGRLDARVGEPVPDMNFLRVSDGAEHRMSDLRGKVTLVNLWATWCPPCVKELPTLNRLQLDYEARGLVVVTLSDEPREDLVAVLQNLAPRTLNGSVPSFGWLAIRDFRPFTLVIDRNGVLRDFVFGAQDYSVFERKIRPYL